MSPSLRPLESNASIQDSTKSDKVFNEDAKDSTMNFDKGMEDALNESTEEDDEDISNGEED
jgi:hypothetical protein